jgi:ribonuclease P protein component
MVFQGNRFRKTDRLLEAAAYKNVFANPFRAIDRYFTVLARLNDKNEARLGLAISKKQARRAVDRNRLKRIARESFRIHRKELPALDFVVMARQEAIRVNNRMLFLSLSSHWKMLNKKFSSPTD